MKAKYTQRKDNEGFEVKSLELTRWKCCDCALVHDIVFVAGRKGSPIGVAAKRNARATAQFRRKNKGGCAKCGKWCDVPGHINQTPTPKKPLSGE